MSKTQTAALFSIVALALLAGCGGAVEEDTNDRELGTASAPAITDEGLTVVEQRADFVRGTFSRHDQTVRFELRTEQDAHLASIFDASGAPLLTSRLRDGVEETVLLGKTKIRGAVDAAEPETGNDPHAFDALNAHPATKIIPELKEALHAHGIAPAMFSAQAKVESSGSSVHTTQWTDISGYTHLGYNEQRNYGTWAFWNYTTVEMRPEGRYTAARLLALTGWSAPEYTGVIYGTTYVRRQYWGVLLNVLNVAPPVCNPSCPNTTLMVRTY